jgi:formate dehydrogenase subunit gamma
MSGLIDAARVAARIALVAALCGLSLSVVAQTPGSSSAATPAPAASGASAPAGDPAMRDLSQEQRKRAVVQPGNNAPVWREVRAGQAGYASLPGRETNVLIQSEGQEWRAKRNGFWSIAAGWLLVGVIALLALAYFVKGTAQLEQPETGRKLLRFTQFERWVHWSAAIAWSTLATTGIVMLFGKNILLPIIGYTLFSWLAILSKNLHNFVGPLFLVSVIVLIVTFARQNLPRAGDLSWLLKLGGLFSKHEPPSGKFNAGEKLWFWGGALVLALVAAGSGLVLDFPNFDQTRATMQTANIVHLIAAGLFMAAGLGHVYLGTLGMAGAYDGMRTGLVDEEWAREHHRYWYDDIVAGKVDADPALDKDGVRPQPAGSDD